MLYLMAFLLTSLPCLILWLSDNVGGKLKSYLTDPPPQESVDSSSKAAALSKELIKRLADSENEDKRINKYEAAIKALQGQIRDLHASILTCRQEKAANEGTIAAITLGAAGSHLQGAIAH